MTVFQVSHPVKWAVVGHEIAVPSVLSWSSEDPVAVKAAFGPAYSETTDWFFSRDLLSDVVSGKYREAGDGDVHVERRTNSGLSGGEWIFLTLSTGNGATLQADADEIKFFLEATFTYAPLGQEELDMDTAIGRLLDGGWASGV